MNILMLLEMAADGFGTGWPSGRSKVGSPTTIFGFEPGPERRRSSRPGSSGSPSSTSPPRPSPWRCMPRPGRACRSPPLNYRLAADQLADQLAQLAPVLVIAGDAYVDIVQAAVPAGGHVTLRVAQACHRGHDVEAPPASWIPTTRPCCCSRAGTTARPKIAVLRHRHLSSVRAGLGRVHGRRWRTRRRWCACRRTTSPASPTAAATSTPAGASCSCPTSRPNAGSTTARREGVTNAMVVPTMLARIVETMRAHPATTGAQPAVDRLRRTRRCRSPSSSTPWSCSPRRASSTPTGSPRRRRRSPCSDPTTTARRWRRRPRRASPPRLGRATRFRASRSRFATSDGAPVPAGESGEIYIRGEQVSGEYRGRAGRSGRRLVAHQGPRPSRRRRLPVRRGPQRRPHHPRWREHQPRPRSRTC